MSGPTARCWRNPLTPRRAELQKCNADKAAIRRIQGNPVPQEDNL